MKKIVLALTLLILATVCYSQAPITPPSTPEPAKGTKEYYLQRSKVKKTKGWIFTPGGLVLTGLGWSMAVGETRNSIATLGEDKNNGAFSSLLILAGVGSFIGGTISFISAGHNKRKARALEVGFEQVPLPPHGSLNATAVPQVSYKIIF
ncbi:hypothetical protein [Sabulibacter ruber]|uniref:hypothetical protein n=1 Tax=Sabulibacter ruber TaxID=2811901 RepID=UPI001A96BC8F|nr:hypothetical protein [Sabulibacter ruber]